MSERMIRVVLADDHEVVRNGIRDYLEGQANIAVIAEASDGQEALNYIADLKPDVAVLDIKMPKLTGVEVTARVRTCYPDVKVLIVTAYDYDPYILAALKAGANGYVLKTARSADLIHAVRTVFAGGSALDPVVTRKVVEHMATGSPYVRGEGMVEYPSAREMDVLRLVARGMDNRTIALTLGISHRTVQGHLANLFDKMAVASRTEAALLALKLGWVMLDEAD